MEHFYQNIGENWMDYENLYSEMVQHFTDGSHFVEIGSWRGRSASFMAVEILNSGKQIKFDCIDTWSGSEEHLDQSSPFFIPELLTDVNWLYCDFLKNVIPVSDYITTIRKTSLEAVNSYDNRSLDFVFIDASHKYNDIKADILAWYPKVKKGGYLCGHDYKGFPDVKLAVDEILISNNLNCTLIENCWIHRK